MRRTVGAWQQVAAQKQEFMRIRRWNVRESLSRFMKLWAVAMSNCRNEMAVELLRSVKIMSRLSEKDLQIVSSNLVQVHI